MLPIPSIIPGNLNLQTAHWAGVRPKMKSNAMKSNAYVFLFYDSVILSLGLAVGPILCNKNFSSECLQSFFHLFIYQIHLWTIKLRDIKPCHHTGPTKIFKCGYLPTQRIWRLQRSTWSAGCRWQWLSAVPAKPQCRVAFLQSTSHQGGGRGGQQAA